jgi:hypothetical protein
MGGDLTATSEGLGRGTTLTFSIPLCVPEPGDPAAAAEVGGQSGDASMPAAAESWDSSSSSALPLPCDDAQVAAAAAAAAAAPQPSPAAPPPPWPPSPSTSSRSLLPPASPSPVPPGGAANVLVAEDDALSQMVMRKLLTALRLRFTIVPNGAAAVEAYKQGTRTHLP